MNLRTITALAVVLACAAGCKKGDNEDGPPKPTDAQAKQAVIQLLVGKAKFDVVKKHAQSSDGNCGVMGGDITSADVTFVAWGIYNEAQRYWPAKVGIEGKCANVIPNCGPDNNSACPPVPADFKLDALTVKLTRDDFGNWTAATP
jgi:hypothetical protein